MREALKQYRVLDSSGNIVFQNNNPKQIERYAIESVEKVTCQFAVRVSSGKGLSKIIWESLE